MARDYTKYNVEGLGENLNKRKLVFTVVKDWIEKNNPSLEELQKAFPDEAQGAKGFIRKESEVVDPKRFNIKEPLKIKNGMHIVVSNQWGENLPGFLEVATKLGYTISVNSVNEIDKESSIENNTENSLELEDFELEVSFPESIKQISICVSNSLDKIYADLGERITIHYDVISNSILKHNSNENEEAFEYLDVFEAEIPDNYLDHNSWIGEMYFSGEVNGKDWDLIFHGDVEDSNNVSNELENALLINFSEERLFQFLDEVYSFFY